MAFALVQHAASIEGTNVFSQAYGSNVTAGNLLIVVAENDNAAGSLSVDIANSGTCGAQTWRPVLSSPFQAATPGRTLQAWWARASGTGSCTVTMTWAANAGEIYVHEFSGASATLVQGAAGSAQGTGATLLLPGISPLTTDNLLFGFAYTVGGQATPQAPWTNVDGTFFHTPFFQANVGPGAYTPNVTQTSGTWATLLFALGQPAPTPPPTVLPNRLGPRAVGPTFFAAFPPQPNPSSASYPSTTPPTGGTGTLAASIFADFLLAGGPFPTPPISIPNIPDYLPRRLGPGAVGPTYFAPFYPLPLAPVSTQYTQALTTVGLSFTGTQAKTTNRPLAGTAASSGLLSRMLSRPLIAALLFTGIIVRLISHGLAGVLSFTGVLSRATQAILSGVASFAGVISHLFPRALSGALSFTGNTTRQINHLVNGALAFAGTISRQVIRTLTAILTFTGAIARVIIALLTAATLSFVGTMTKLTRRVLTGVLTFTGVVSRLGLRALVGVLTFTGSLAKRTQVPLIAILSFTGTLGRSTQAIFIGVLSFAGTTSRSAARGLSAVLSFAGTIIKRPARLLTGVLSFTGSLLTGSARFRVLSGILSFAGGLSKQTGAVLSGVLSFTGAIQRAIVKALSAVLTTSGALARAIRRGISGALSFAGSLTASRLRLVVLSAVSTLTGTVAKQTGRPLAGTLSFVGTVRRSVTKVLSGVLSSSGFLARTLARPVTGALSFAGSVLTHNVRQAILSGALSFTGTVSKRTTAILTASSAFAGTITRQTARGLAASVSFTGVVARRILRIFAASVSLTGAIAKAVGHVLASAILRLAGALTTDQRVIFMNLTASLSFLGSRTEKLLRPVYDLVLYVAQSVYKFVVTSRPASVAADRSKVIIARFPATEITVEGGQDEILLLQTGDDTLTLSRSPLTFNLSVPDTSLVLTQAVEDDAVTLGS